MLNSNSLATLVALMEVSVPLLILNTTGHSYSEFWGTGIRGLMRHMTNLPQGNQELLVVRDKVGRPPGELGVSKSMDCNFFPSVL